MKHGRTLPELAQEIQRQREAKADYVADTRKLHLNADGDRLRLEVAEHGDYDITEHAHRQIGERIGIPAKYYQRMKQEAPGLLAENINHWFDQKPEPRMVRTLDGKARAFLSDRYRPLDHHDLAEAVLPVLARADARVESCEITPGRLYIKGVMEDVRQTIPPPPGGQQTPVTVSPGIVVSNSETGEGALSIQPAVHFLRCTNLAVWAQHALRKHHVGRVHNETEEDSTWQFLSDRTKDLSDAALWSQVQDMTAGALEGAIFDNIVEDLRKARSQPIGNSVVPAVEKLVETRGLQEKEQGGILALLIEGGDLTKFGLSNAVTAFSQEAESYERATYLEQLGGEIITLPPKEWELITA